MHYRLFTSPFIRWMCLLFFGFNYSYAQTLLPIIENPSIVHIDKLPAHCSYFPYESMKLAMANNPKLSIRYLSLNGYWKFNWAKHPASRPVEFLNLIFLLMIGIVYRSSKLASAWIWYTHYVNIPYPFSFDSTNTTRCARQ